jgi:hypothetical protein
MNNALNKLYELESSDGRLTWETCNLINSHLAKISVGDIPADQSHNVVEYLEYVLWLNSALPQHRDGIAIALACLKARQAGITYQLNRQW